MYQVCVFISHSWKYSNHYETLASWIFLESWNVDGIQLNFVNSSVPKDDPIHNAPTSSELQRRIYELIAISDVVVIPTGMYSSHSTWIQKEINGAVYYGKPILAVDPWGQERKSSVVLSNASDSCGWNKQSTINKIWNLSPKRRI